MNISMLKYKPCQTGALQSFQQETNYLWNRMLLLNFAEKAILLEWFKFVGDNCSVELVAAFGTIAFHSPKNIYLYWVLVFSSVSMRHWIKATNYKFAFFFQPAAQQGFSIAIHFHITNIFLFLSILDETHCGPSFSTVWNTKMNRSTELFTEWLRNGFFKNQTTNLRNKNDFHHFGICLITQLWSISMRFLMISFLLFFF